MNEKNLYQTTDEIIGDFLDSYDFRIINEGEYIREENVGYDRILIDSISGRKKIFSVMMCFYPQYFYPIYELVENSGEDQGFPCGPYLSPVGVTQREKYWSYKNKDQLNKSMIHVIECIKKVGLPWLQSLREPNEFVSEVDQNALLHAAFANEYVKNYKEAKNFYSEILNRYKAIIDKYGPKTMTKFMKMEFVFVSSKLGEEKQQRANFEIELKYKSNFDPLPEET